MTEENKRRTGWIASAPLLTAAAMMLGMFRYEAELGASPMQTASSASYSSSRHVTRWILLHAWHQEPTAYRTDMRRVCANQLSKSDVCALSRHLHEGSTTISARKLAR